jgi:hypothetical protein
VVPLVVYKKGGDPTLCFYLYFYSLPQLVDPFTDQHLVSSVYFNPTPSTSENMPIQRRTINIGSVLGTLAPEPSETSDLPLAPRFSEGESVMKKRKKGEEGVEGAREQQALVQTESSVTKSPSKKGKGKNSRAPQKATGHVSHKRKHQKELPAPWSCEFYVNGRPVNEDDSIWKSKDVRGGQIADAIGRALLLPKDMRAWQGNNSAQMIENLKRDSVVVSFVFYPLLSFFFFFFIFHFIFYFIILFYFYFFYFLI